jgi:hypothetical protein
MAGAWTFKLTSHDVCPLTATLALGGEQRLTAGKIRITGCSIISEARHLLQTTTRCYQSMSQACRARGSEAVAVEALETSGK